MKRILRKIYDNLKDHIYLLKSFFMLNSYTMVFGLLVFCISSTAIIKYIGLAIAAINVFIIFSGVCGYVILRIRRAIQKKNAPTPTQIIEEKRKINIEKNAKENEKIVVGFYCDGGQFWSTFADLYELLKADSRFETIVIAAPETYQHKIYHYNAIEFLEKKGIPYIAAYENRKWFEYEKLKFNYVFYNRHYLSRQAYVVSYAEARKYAKVCYIPYALCPQKGAVEETLCSFRELRMFDFLFAENQMMTKIYENYKRKQPEAYTRIETVGSPKFEYVLKHTEKNECDSKYKQVILYTPRWNFKEGTNSFYELKDYFFELVQANSDIEYIFRPHPLMAQTMKEVWGEERWNEYLAKFDEYENAYVDLEEDYTISFRKATVLVSDLSTMMFEFSVTGKPVIYMYKRDLLNDFGHLAEKGYYRCCGAESVDSKLKELRNGIDESAEIRQQVSNSLYFTQGKSSVEIIRDILIEDNNTEKRSL